ncbi:hypothetical protein LWP59_33480 [Amycolatopsis acidiphila]|uniref:DUF6542 domain-containing protein n=1 Tax=Amycolatopsis acidiphila TaxID=715473 RepID=A0A558A4C7_9PSEU|nr:DUF6542 domain-containing protein [Amycolatopsis acidiphila]TVT19119.1 hypothetical protein FNH06_25400 [Amycolatopsis acidiphila]UIJ58942.1 hypothetical protein LWP59_33480 [Amycolatopsis acidiphila]
MTAIRDRPSDPDADEVAVPWDERPVVGERRGLPWWGAVLLAFGLALVGAIADMQLQNTLGWVFRICYFVGAVAAICAVQRRSIFGPMVQPPLVLAVTVPLVVLLVSGLPANSDTLAKALAVGTPLINGFPMMAITTGFTLAIGIVRLYRERNPIAPAKGSKAAASDQKRTSGPRTRDGAAPRTGKPAREGAGREAREGTAGREGGATRVRRPAEGRSSQRPGGGEQHPSLPMTPRRRPEDPPRRGEAGARGGEARGDRRERGDEPGARGGKTPPPVARRGRPRGATPDDERRRGSGEGRDVPEDRPRRLPPRPGSREPRGGSGEPPRRAPGRRNGPPPRGPRPWDNED